MFLEFVVGDGRASVAHTRHIFLIHMSCDGNGYCYMYSTKKKKEILIVKIWQLSTKIIYEIHNTRVASHSMSDSASKQHNAFVSPECYTIGIQLELKRREAS